MDFSPVPKAQVLFSRFNITPVGWIMTKEGIRSAANNEVFIFAARTCMILASTVGLPIAGFMLSQVWNAAVSIENRIVALEFRQKLLEQASAMETQLLKEEIKDHEFRLRTIEHTVVIPAAK
jgi:hypothetical protein